jgi:hypothetical protein
MMYRAAALLALTVATILLAACEDPISRWKHSPQYQEEVRHSLEQDKKGNGCLKC